MGDDMTNKHNLLIEIEDELSKIDLCLDRLQLPIEKLRGVAKTGTLNQLEDSSRNMYDEYLKCSEALSALIDEWMNEKVEK